MKQRGTGTISCGQVRKEGREGRAVGEFNVKGWGGEVYFVPSSGDTYATFVPLLSTRPSKSFTLATKSSICLGLINTSVLRLTNSEPSNFLPFGG